MVITVVSRARKLPPIVPRSWLNERSIKFSRRSFVHQLIDKLHRLNHRLQIARVFQHAGIDSWQLMGIPALEKNPPSVSLLEQVGRYRHHALDARYFCRRSHVDVKIRTVVERILPDDEPKTRNNPVLF